MIDIKAIDDIAMMMSFTLSLVSANLLIVRRSHKHIYRWLALFFIANAITELPSILELATVESYKPSRLVYLMMAFTLPILLTLSPLLWMYVRAITAEDRAPPRRGDTIHFLPALVSTSLSVLLLAAPWSELKAATAAPDPMTVPLVLELHIYLMGFVLVFIVQCGFYAVMITRRLMSYRKRLRDLFSSTEDRELHWAGWLGLFMACYVVSSLIAHFSVLEVMVDQGVGEDRLDLLPEVFGLMFLWTLAIWGLRQKPGLIARPEEMSESKTATPKYERSALSDEHARRIAKKISAAMREKHLYRNPNLSLWELSNTIRVSSNYVSQTLNTTLGRTFFDYVNGWRIAEAKEKLTSTDDTILAIAYEVGFNSRSSFYTAFKRDTGVTPNQYRQKYESHESKVGEAGSSVYQQSATSRDTA